MANNKDIIYKKLQELSDAGAEEGEFAEYLSSVGENPSDYIVGYNEPQKKGFIDSFVDLVSSGKERVRSPQKTTDEQKKKGLLSGLGMSGPAAMGNIPSVAKEDPKLALSGVAESIPFLSPNNILGSAAIAGGSAFARDKLLGKSSEEAAMQGGIEGGTDAAINSVISAIPVIGKYVVNPALKFAGSMTSGVPVNKYSEAVTREFAGDSVFVPGWNKENEVIDKISQKLHSGVKSKSEAFDLSSKSSIEKQKNAIDKAGSDALKSFKKLQLLSGAEIGKEKAKMIRDAMHQDFDPSRVLKDLDSIIKGAEIKDKSGTTSYLKDKEIEFINKIRDELSGSVVIKDSKGNVISEKDFNDLVSKGVPESRFQKEVKPISLARAHKVIGDLSEFIDFVPYHELSNHSKQGSARLASTRRMFNEDIRAVNPGLAAANDADHELKRIKGSIAESATDKSLSNMIKKYHEGKLNIREVDDLERLNELSGIDFLGSSVPQKIDDEAIEYMKQAKSIGGSERRARSSLNRLDTLTPGEMDILEDIDRTSGVPFLDEAQKQNIAKEFVNFMPGRGGGSGSQEGAANIARAGVTSKAPALAPLFSPALNAKMIQAAPGVQKGVSKGYDLISKIIRKSKAAFIPYVMSGDDGQIQPRRQ